MSGGARKKVLVLGGSGMLGSMVVDHLALDPRLEVHATVRSDALRAMHAERLPRVAWHLFDADGPDVADGLAPMEDCAFVVNAIGITKPHIRDDHVAERETALRVNALLPHLLDERAGRTGSRVLQIATDCVYSGGRGRYVESDAHDALDVYGKTKSLGEVPSSRFHHLRCSIIGPEPREQGKFLLEWFLGQPRGVAVRGFVNHQWNGVTTLHFARLCHGIIVNDLVPPALQHVVPGGDVTKHELLGLFAKAYGRSDIVVESTEAPTVVDRTLRTDDQDANRELWRAAGFDTPPTVADMVHEMATCRCGTRDG